MSSGKTGTRDFSKARELFEDRFASETLSSERRRVFTLASVFGALLLLAVLVPLISGKTPFTRTIFLLGFEVRSWFLCLMASAAVYETVMWIYLRHAARTGKDWGTIARYLNALVEISIPSAVIVLMATVYDPVCALTQPAVFMYFIFIIFSTLRLDVRLSVFTGAVAALEYSFLNLLYLAAYTNPSIDPLFFSPMYFVGRPFLMLLGGVAAGFVAGQIKKQVVSSILSVEEHNRVLGIFGQHVSPEVADKLVGHTHGVESEIRTVCVLFMDIRGFTSFSENKKPEEVVQYLNDLFAILVDIVNKNGGIINKFLGDGFMALFGAPLSDGNDSSNAVRAALEMCDVVEKAGTHGKIPPTRIGVGLHMGEALTGSIGSLQRKEYSIIGDVVNLASRVEAMNKQFESRILITDAVLNALTNRDEIEAEPLGPVSVKGREQPVHIYRLA